METKVCGGAGYAVEDFRMSLGHGDAWVGVPVDFRISLGLGDAWIML